MSIFQVYDFFYEKENPFLTQQHAVIHHHFFRQTQNLFIKSCFCIILSHIKNVIFQDLPTSKNKSQLQ